MTRNELINAFAAANTRPAIVAWLKAADAYSGKLADGTRICRARIADQRDHMSTVQAALVKARTADAKKATKAAKAAKATRGAKAIADNKARTARSGTIAKLGQAITDAVRAADGTIVLTPEDYVRVGLGYSWPRLSNRLFNTPGTMQHTLFTALGYAAHNAKETTVLTPIATDAKEVAA